MVLVAQLKGDHVLTLFESNLIEATLLTLLTSAGQTFEEWTAGLDCSIETKCAAVARLDQRNMMNSWYGPAGRDSSILHYANNQGRRYRLATSAERLAYEGPNIGYK